MGSGKKYNQDGIFRLLKRKVNIYSIQIPFAFMFLAIWEKLCYEKECNEVNSADGTENLELNCNAAEIVSNNSNCYFQMKWWSGHNFASFVS